MLMLAVPPFYPTEQIHTASRVQHRMGKVDEQNQRMNKLYVHNDIFFNFLFPFKMLSCVTENLIWPRLLAASIPAG